MQSKDRLIGQDFSLLELIFGEYAVLLSVVLIIALSWNSGLVSILSLVFGVWFLLEVTLSTLDVLESFLESLFDGKDLGGCLIQEVVNLWLNLGVCLVVILLELDLRNSSLNFSDEVTESLLGGLFSIINITTNSLRSFLDKFLLGLSNNLLIDDFLGLLLSSQFVNLNGLFL